MLTPRPRMGRSTLPARLVHPLAACPLGTYGPNSGQELPTACIACPSGTSTASPGASAIGNCLCNAGTIGTITSAASTCSGMRDVSTLRAGKLE